MKKANACIAHRKPLATSQILYKQTFKTLKKSDYIANGRFKLKYKKLKAGVVNIHPEVNEWLENVGKAISTIGTKIQFLMF